MRVASSRHKEETQMAERTVAAPTASRTPATIEGTRNQERYMAPPVDIYETLDGLVVMADLPGVTQEDLDVRVENNILTIRGRSRHIAPSDPIYREHELINFFRQFELGEKIDQSKISAELKYGVLTLTLPKAEEAKPRKIAVKIG
jgi:HSP20 family molecular chaperone IbpA